MRYLTNIHNHPTAPVELLQEIDLKNHYPEFPVREIAQVHNGIEGTPTAEPSKIPFYVCGKIQRGHCEHQYTKLITCSREWCPDCGRDNSITHKRRMDKWLNKVLYMPYMGYLVITVPEQLRETFKDRQVLSDFRNYNKRKLQRMGYIRGICRYHWAGDCKQCKGKGCTECEQTGMSRDFNPHLNFFIEDSHISRAALDRYRADLANWFNTKFETELKWYAKDNHRHEWKVRGNLFYEYCKPGDTAQKIHKLRYVTRSTWRHWDPQMIQVITKFKTGISWGQWKAAAHIADIKTQLQKIPAEISRNETLKKKTEQHREKFFSAKHSLWKNSEADSFQLVPPGETLPLDWFTRKMKYYDSRIAAKELNISLLKESRRKWNWYIKNYGKNTDEHEETALTKLEKSHCPLCDKKIHWHHHWQCKTCKQTEADPKTIFPNERDYNIPGWWKIPQPLHLATEKHRICKCCGGRMRYVPTYESPDAGHGNTVEIAAGYYLTNFETLL